MINQQILNYTIIQELGKGGMATVYKAKHNTFENRFVAVKILDSIFSRNQDAINRFVNEAKIMASFEHKNIVKVLDFDNKNNQMAIIMELLDGEDLKSVIDKKILDKQQNIEIFKQILNAIEYGHNKKVIHRDLKPSNVFIIDNLKTAKVLDFGIAKLLESDNQMTLTGFQMGTPVFMSPEQVKGNRNLDNRTDIYSLGVLLYYMFAQKPPFDQNTSQYEILTKIVNEPLPTLFEFPEINSIISKATLKNPDHRYQNCNEFLNAFNNLNQLSGFIEISNIEETNNETKKETKHQYEGQHSKAIEPELIHEIVEKTEQKTEQKPTNSTKKKKTHKSLKTIISLILLVTAVFLTFKFLNISEKKTFELYFESEKNEEAFNIIADQNGIFIVGLTKSMNSSMDWLLIKTNLNGVQKIKQNFDGYERGDAAHSIIQVDKDKYLIVGGVYKDENHQAQSRVIMINKNCEVLWDKEFGFEGWDEAVDITKADNDNFIFVYTDNTGKTTRIGIYKIDKNGNLIWEKSVGENADFSPRSILKINENEFIITGKIAISETYEKAYILFIDSNGKILKEKSIGEYNQLFDAEDVILIDNDNFIITGYAKTDKDFKELWLAKIDSEAEIIKEKYYQVIENTVGVSLCKFSENEFLTVGYTSENDSQTDAFILKFDKDFNKLESEIFGGGSDDSFKSVYVYKKSIYIAGYTFSKGNGSKNIWLLKLNSNCQL